MGMKRGEGTCSKCMVISVEEVMESGHFYGTARPPTSAFTTTEHAYFIPIQSLKNVYWKEAA